MKFNKIIANPPYNKGGKIMQACFSHNPEADYSILMPASCYFKDDFFNNIKTIEPADNTAFEKTAIQKNLCICTMKANNNQWTKEDFLMYFCDQKYKDFYKYNIEHYKGFSPIRNDYIDVNEYNIDLDFVEHSRCVSDMCGNGFGKGGGGYAFNIEKDKEKFLEHLPSMRFWIHFSTPQEKENFSKWWYYKGKGKGLASKLMMGIGTMTMSSFYKWAIPQIDWERIHQTTFWKGGKLDAAVACWMFRDDEELKTLELASTHWMDWNYELPEEIIPKIDDYEKRLVS